MTNSDKKEINTDQAKVELPVKQLNEEEEISEETVAVIMAALTAYYQTTQHNTPYYFSETFAAIGCAEYYKATKDKAVLDSAEKYFDVAYECYSGVRKNSIPTAS